jgi:hypothetical protein
MTAFPQAQVSVWKKMGHHPQRERPSELAQFIEAACRSDHASARDAASGPTPRRQLVAVGARTPRPPTAGATGELPAVA